MSTTVRDEEVMRILFKRCGDCAGRGHIPIRIVGMPTFGRDIFGRPSSACGGGAVRCSCAAGFRAVVVHSRRSRW